MVSPSLAWPDTSLRRGIIACSIQAIMRQLDLGLDTPDLVSPNLAWPDEERLLLAQQVIMPLHDWIGSCHVKLDVTFRDANSV